MTTAIARNDSEPPRIVVDSSGWLEYLTDDVNAARFAPYLEGNYEVVVPAIVVYEVYKKLLATSGRSAAESFASEAASRPNLPLDATLAIRAATVSVDRRLALADAIVYATAIAQNAELITGDAHFEGLPGVVVL